MTMDSCIGVVIASQLLVEGEGRILAAHWAVTIATDHNHDQEMQAVLAMATRYASRLVAIEYAKARRTSRLWKFIVADELHESSRSSDGGDTSRHDVRACLGDTYMLDPDNRGGKEVLVDGTQWSCSCTFHMTTLLHYAHAMKIRAMQGVVPMTPLHLVAERWRVHSLGSKLKMNVTVDDGGLRVRSRATKRVPMSGSEKFARFWLRSVTLRVDWDRRSSC